MTRTYYLDELDLLIFRFFSFFTKMYSFVHLLNLANLNLGPWYLKSWINSLKVGFPFDIGHSINICADVAIKFQLSLSHVLGGPITSCHMSNKLMNFK